MYNTGFPATYPYQRQNQGLIWVQGEAAAKSYLVAPNNTVQLWDSESQTIYLKSADASGMPSIRVLDYTIRENAPKTLPNAFPAQDDKSPTFATKDEIKAIQDEMRAIREELTEIKGRKDE